MLKHGLPAIVEVKETRMVHMKPASPRQTVISKEVVELNVADGDYNYVIIISNQEYDLKQSFWLKWFERITGLKIRFFDSFMNGTPNLLIDKVQRISYIHRDLLRLRITQFMTLIKQIADVLVNGTSVAFQRLQGSIGRWSSELSVVSHRQFITVKHTSNGLQLPASFKLSADDYYVNLIAYDNELLLRTANYSMSAAVDTLLPLTVIEVMIRFDGILLEIQLPKELQEALVGVDTIQFDLKKLH